MANILGLNPMSEEREQGVQIRLTAPDDAVAIASLLYESFVEYEALYTPEGFGVTVSTPEQVQARMKEGPVWVALENEAVVGTVSAVLKDQGLYIRGMAVDPSARGSGVGRKLLDCTERFAVQMRCRRLCLSTTPFLSRAIKLYENYGFHRNSEGPDNLFGTPLFTMVKALQSIKLRKTEETDLDYVLGAEHSEENCPFVIPWSREKHLQALSDPDLAHLIVKVETKVGYVILAGLLDPNQSIEFRRIVITEKGWGYGKATVGLVKELVFETYKAHRLWLDVKEKNHRARAVYEAAGFFVEGTLRECLRAGNGYDSLVIMSLLKQEYEDASPRVNTPMSKSEAIIY
jgi:diamine N-acetyltransferase